MNGVEWFTVEHAAAWLGVKPATVLVVAHREKWRRIKVGHHVGYHPDDVDDTREKRAARRNGASGVRS